MGEPAVAGADRPTCSAPAFGAKAGGKESGESGYRTRQAGCGGTNILPCPAHLTRGAGSGSATGPGVNAESVTSVTLSAGCAALLQPDQSPYAMPGLNPGTVRTALRSLVQSELLEVFGDQHLVTAPLKTMLMLHPGLSRAQPPQ